MKLHWDESGAAASNARKRLPALAAAYFAEGRKVVGHHAATATDVRHFRLSTKRLRYTLELFRDCYGPGLEARLAELQDLQTLLGAMNDCAATRRLLEGTLSPASPHRRRMTAFLAQREAAQATDFRLAWTNRFDAPGREARWLHYLERYARTR